MQLSKSQGADGTRIAISGELDSVTAPEVRDTFDTIAGSQPAKVVLDLTALRLIDSSGVGAIVSLFKRVKASGGSFEVVGVQGQPRAIFRVLKLDRVFGVP
jgi:anti-sigma B factor antagonist